MQLMTKRCPGNEPELLVILHWARLAVAVARALLVTWMVGKLVRGTSDRVNG